MTYTIEIVIKNKDNMGCNLNEPNETSESIKYFLFDLAKGLNCNDEYFNYELEGIGHLIKKNICIYTVIFLKEDFNNFLEFIKFLKPVKNIYIDSIYEEDIKLNMIYKYSKKHKLEKLDKLDKLDKEYVMILNLL